MDLKQITGFSNLFTSQGERIRHARELSGLSRRAFARRFNVNLSTLQAWEENRYKKGLASAAAQELANVFQSLGVMVTPEWLLSGAGEAPIDKAGTSLESPAKNKTWLNERVRYFNDLREKNLLLIEAITNNKLLRCKQLIDEGANLHKLKNRARYLYGPREDTALHYAASFAGKAIIDFFIDMGLHPNVRNRHQDAPLHLACYSHNQAALYALISNDANLEAASREGATPLMWASYLGYKEGCEILLKAGANLHNTDYYGNTAMHWAAFNNQCDVITELFNMGADVYAKNVDDMTPIDWAVENGRISALNTIMGLIEK